MRRGLQAGQWEYTLASGGGGLMEQLLTSSKHFNPFSTLKIFLSLGTSEIATRISTLISFRLFSTVLNNINCEIYFVI
jgi:hypothetical protein